MPTAAPARFANDADVLNYALTLERLIYAFYRDGLHQFDATAFAKANRPASVYPTIANIRDQEETHVATLREAIQQLGGTAVDEAVYDFGYKDVVGFLAVAEKLENTLVAAYDGAISAISDKTVLRSIAGILSVEGRHAAYINIRNAVSAFPTATDAGKTRPDVLAIVAPFIKPAS